MVRNTRDSAADLRRRARYCAEWAAMTTDSAERDQLFEKSRALLALAAEEDWLAGKRLDSANPDHGDDQSSSSDDDAANAHLLGPPVMRAQQAAE